MIAWLWNLIVGQFCIHKWEVYGRMKITENGIKEEPTLFVRHYMRCIKCGNIKTREL